MRLIDADALIKYANNSTVGIDANDIARFPRVDAVPVVRCAGCRYGYVEDDGYMMCGNADGYDPVEPNGYCAWGERKDGADNG